MVIREGSGEEEVGEVLEDLEDLEVVIPGLLLRIANTRATATWTVAVHSRRQAGDLAFGLGRWVVLRLATSLAGTRRKVHEQRQGGSRAFETVILEKAVLDSVRHLGSRLPLRELALVRADAGSVVCLVYIGL